MASGSAPSPVPLPELIALLDGHVERIEHHEHLEVTYVTWLTSIIGVLIGSAAALLSPPLKLPPSAIHHFVAGLCAVGFAVSVVGIAIHWGLMDYIDGLTARREAIEEEIAVMVGGAIAESLRKKFPSRRIRLWIRSMFGLFAIICLALVIYAVKLKPQEETSPRAQFSFRIPSCLPVLIGS